MMSLGFVFHRQCCWLAVQKGSSSLGQVIGDAMLTVGERSCDHATPRQMALLEEEIVESPTSKDATLTLVWERNMACHIGITLSARLLFINLSAVSSLSHCGLYVMTTAYASS